MGDFSDQKLNENFQYSDQQNSDEPTKYREQDMYLPLNNIATIMRKSVPSNGKVAKEAKECVQECASEFISFITSEAAERCAKEKRKTVNGEDILYAMQTLGFDEYLNLVRSTPIPKKHCVGGEEGENNEGVEYVEDD